MIREALARRSASIMMNISIRCSFAGGLVDCTTKTSSPRTFSSILTKVSPLGNGRTIDRPSGTPMDSQMDRARTGFELPEKTFTAPAGNGVVAEKNTTGLRWQSDRRKLTEPLAERQGFSPVQRRNGSDSAVPEPVGAHRNAVADT